MKKLSLFVLSSLFFCVFASGADAPALAVTEPVIVMDKKANQLHITNYDDGKLTIVKTFRATTGQKVGDKLMEGDLKTPEGIYEFLYRAHAPQLKPIFGPLAIYIAYPNVMDKNGSKTGFDILLHGTDDPSRLERPFDSKGCVVLDNENVKVVSDLVKMKDTKIIITKDFAKLQANPRLEKAKAFFDKWIKAWSNKDLSTYVESYADEFKVDGMNRLAFSRYKESLNEKYETINVTATNVKYYFHEKYDQISFEQHYKSTLKGGIPAYNGSSHKHLYLQERNGEYRIIVEEPKK